jgi:GntR family transcriptional regulator / MocR family aminotransferase
LDTSSSVVQSLPNLDSVLSAWARRDRHGAWILSREAPPNLVPWQDGLVRAPDATHDSWTSYGLDLVIALDGTKRGLTAALKTALQEAIRDGRLRAGERLPSTRSLAGDLGIARGTVVEAYEQLLAEGWLVTRQGHGTSIADVPEPIPPSAEPPPAWSPPHDLRPGHADPSSFPRHDWASVMRKVLSESPDEAFGYADPKGRMELRSALAGYLGRARGVRVAPAQLHVCTGAGHGMGLAFRVLAGRGASRIAVEDPSSARLREIATAAGLQLVPLPCDQLGARADVVRALEVNAVVVTPAHQYPLGVTLAPERRSGLLAWASASRGVVIEDDYDGELRYDRQPVGALQGLDPQRVIYAGTLSKSLAAGLRIGWLAAPPRLMESLVQTAQVINASPSSLEQLAFARFIEAGLFDKHIRRMRGVYRKRRDLLISTLASRAPRLQVSGIAAGGHALLRLPPDGPSEREVIVGAASRGLALAGLSDYRFPAHPAPDPHGPALVIGYGSPAGRSYRNAIAALAEYLQAVYSGNQ